MSKKVTFIETYNNALPDYLCDWVIAYFDQQKSLDIVHTGRTLGGINKELKDSYDLTIDEYEYGIKNYFNKINEYTVEHIEKYMKKYAIYDTGNPTDEGNFYVTQPWIVKRYIAKEKQGYHMWHTDWSNHPRTIERGLAVIYFLNDVKEGGETEFYHYKVKIKPKKGSILIFPAYFTHTHKGNIPISNDKNILNNFFYFRTDFYE